MRTDVNKETQWILSISSSQLHPPNKAVRKEVVHNQKRKFPYPYLRTTGPNNGHNDPMQDKDALCKGAVQLYNVDL